MIDAVAYLSALAVSALYPQPLPLRREDHELLMRAADELRRLRAELERKEKR